MKNCCLWINGKKISDVNAIKENFNISDVRGYFYGGRLADWLEAHGGSYEAELVRRIPKGANPDNMLQEIFCGKKEAPVVSYHRKTVQPPFIGAGSCAEGNMPSSGLSSFNGSYSAVAGSYGSFRFHSGYEFGKGSFKLTSFNLTSFKLGSFAYGSFTYGSFSYGSFSGFLTAKNGSFSYDDFVNTLRIREKALLSYFTSEPLNKFGYGIHLV
ncbi:MAG: hypothetical protein IJZ51_09720 [Ruminiclostridium sp.]|nr:hypothetical protein [Ruminiclostridium sp.]